MSGNTTAASFNAILGATGCGKSTALKVQLGANYRKIPRTFCLSPKEEQDRYIDLFPNSVYCRTANEVLAILEKAGRTKPFHIVFLPTFDEKADRAMWSLLCKAFLAVGNMTLIADELHVVTCSTDALVPHGWKLLNNMGRAKKISVFGISPRPTSLDKYFLGNLSSLHVGRLAFAADQKAMSAALNVSHSEVAALSGYQAIQRNMLTGEITRKK